MTCMWLFETPHDVFQYTSQGSPGQYPLDTFIEELNSKDKRKHGEFSKVDQHPEKPFDRMFAFNVCQPRKAVRYATALYANFRIHI